MTLKEVQNAYAIFDPTSFAIVLVFMVIALGSIHLLDVKIFKGTKDSFLKSMLITIPIFFVGMIFLSIIYKNEMNELDNEVKEQYIEKLPEEKMEVISYGNIDITDVEIKNYHFTQEESEILALKVRFNKDGIIRERIIEAQVKVVEDLKQAYLEYQILEKDLADNVGDLKFKKGYYNTTLYIPK